MAKQQLVFGSDGEIKETIGGLTAAQLRRQAEYDAALERRKGIRAVCPWCLFRGTLDKFSKQGKDLRMLKNVECPSCGQGMKQKTVGLVDRLGPAGYSRWLWDQVFTWKAHEKVRWEPLKQAVRAMGFTKTFWDTWRSYKQQREDEQLQQTMAGSRGREAGWKPNYLELFRGGSREDGEKTENIQN